MISFEPLIGMTFPFSNHNCQLRFWMAAGGVDPDKDVRLIVLPPPYRWKASPANMWMFLVGAPLNSVAVDLGVGNILHFRCEIMAQVSEKVLALRQRWPMKILTRFVHLFAPSHVRRSLPTRQSIASMWRTLLPSGSGPLRTCRPHVNGKSQDVT